MIGLNLVLTNNIFHSHFFFWRIAAIINLSLKVEKRLELSSSFSSMKSYQIVWSDSCDTRDKRDKQSSYEDKRMGLKLNEDHDDAAIVQRPNFQGLTALCKQRDQKDSAVEYLDSQ